MPPEVIVDMCGVITRDGNAGEEKREKLRAGIGKLIENERSARQLSENSKQAGAGRRLQHAVGRRNRSGNAGCEAKADRRRELLKRLALF